MSRSKDLGHPSRQAGFAQAARQRFVEQGAGARRDRLLERDIGQVSPCHLPVEQQPLPPAGGDRQRRHETSFARCSDVTVFMLSASAHEPILRSQLQSRGLEVIARNCGAESPERDLVGRRR